MSEMSQSAGWSRIALAGLGIGILIPAEGRADGFARFGDIALIAVCAVSIPVGVGVLMAATLRRIWFVVIGLGGGAATLFASPFGFALAYKYARSDPVFVALMLVPGLVVGVAVFGIAALVMWRSERADKPDRVDPSAGPPI